MPNMPELTVFSIECSHGDGAEVRLEYCLKRISVSVFPSAHSSRCAHSCHKSLAEDRVIDLLSRGATTPDDDEHEEILGDVVGIILNAGKAIFDDIRSDLARNPGTGLLYLRLLTLSGELSVVPIEPEDAYADSDLDAYRGFKAEDDIYGDFPRYSPVRSFTEQPLLAGEGKPWCVLSDDETVFVKDCPSGVYHDELLDQEFKRMREIRNAGFYDHTRQPQAYVEREPSIYPVGFLPQWTSGDIEDMDSPSPTVGKGYEWASDSHELDERFYDPGIAWEEAKNGSILEDSDGDAWVICSGRGWEEDSVDEEIAIPMAADELGPDRIVELSDDE